ncbi:MAG: helix-turn-helix domain-containing protein [Bacteroidales bacterium]|jgi:HTH-type transcriptional regulator/antitoxin HigA|nr:helix-turn-helix domain-containing protein [Bacteroidales bacterium]
MAKIKTELEYSATMSRIEELLSIVGENTLASDKNMIELVLLSDLVEEYDTELYPVGNPSLTETMKLRMFEMNITQKDLAEILGVSPSRVSEYLTGKSEPTLPVARNLSRKLKIDAEVVLGV